MKRTNRRFVALLALCVLALFAAVPMALTWQQIRQQRLNQALYRAVEQRATDRVRTLLRAGADSNVRASSTPAPTGPLQWFRLMLHPTPQKNTGPTALITAIDLAIDTDSQEIVRILINAGADVNASCQDGDEIMRPLDYAVGAADPKLVEMLLNGGAAPNLSDDYVDTNKTTSTRHLSLLEMAARGPMFDSGGAATKSKGNSAKIVKMLLAHEVHFNIRSEEAKRIAFEATANRDTGVVALLLDRGISIEVRNPDGEHESLLSKAAQRGNVGAVALLLARGARINRNDDTGTTALGWVELQRFRELSKGATKQDVADEDAVIALLKAHGVKGL